MWSATPERLRFHVMADTGVYLQLEQTPIEMLCRAAAPRLRCGAIRLHNTTDAALRRRFSRLAHSWHSHFRQACPASMYLVIETASDANPRVPLRAQMSKAYTYAAPKLFINELLPNVDQALLLDTDIIVLADVCELADGFAAVTARPENPLMALGYALEQQGERCFA